VSAETVFSVASFGVFPGWMLLILAPRWAWTRRIVLSGALSAALAVAYLAILLRHFLGAPGGFGSLDQVSRLFQDPWLLLAGWIHYLAFDLLVGAWEVQDAQTRRIAHVAVVPCLVLTFLFGPVGFLAYLGLRAIMGKEPEGRP
jgi:ABA4-like protein